ncbi:MAG: ABC transporter permease [Dokdonella sp.]|uniref:ABC transporter permease n=1 Tax=Dokdonella sp. TaxID=2291710 RepID=UPI003263ACF5
MLDTLMQDLRYGLRTLAARPGFTAAALLTLALAIGANTLVFSLIEGIYLKPLPYRDDAALIDIENAYPKMGLAATGASIPDYLDRREQVPALTDSALYSGDNFNLAENGAPERVHGIRATPSLFSTLGVSATLGRTFTEEEAVTGRDKVVVLGNALWMNQFNADASVVGRELRLNGENYRVVGVMPASFMFPDRETVLYVPFAFTDAQKAETQRGTEFSIGIARLAPGATIADAKAQCDLVIQRNFDRIDSVGGAQGAQFARFMRDAGFTVNVRPLRSLLAGDHAQMLLLLQIAVALVLLIASANIANLLLTRLSARQKELSVRAALGASAARIARQLLIEALLLALIGAALGIGVAVAGQRLVAMSGLLPDWVSLGLDLRVLSFTFAVAVGTGVLFGLFPVVSARLSQPQRVLRESTRIGGGGRGAIALRNALVVTQLALAVALLASAGLLMRSFANVIDQSPGFDANGVLTAAIALPHGKYPDPASRARVMARFLDAARALPGVTAAGLTDVRPMSGAVNGSSYALVGHPGNGATPHAFVRTVDADYFRAMGIALQRGRTFNSDDWNSANKVALVDALFAQKRFPDGDAIGQVLDLDRPGVSGQQYAIVGVVDTVKNGDLGEDVTQETFYLDYGQSPTDTVALVLRTRTEPGALAAPLRAAIHAIDAEQPLFDMMTLDQRVQLSLTGRRVPMQLIGVFAALALLLAAIGIYGVLAFAVTQRTGEFGVRMAIGANGSQIRREVMSDGVWLIGIGIGTGVVGAFGLGMLLKSQLFGVDSIDLPSLVAVVGVLASTALAACWLPARRASRVAPTEALRHE